MAQPNSASDARAFPFLTDAACFKRPIDHPTNPARNHPIHDAVEIIEYSGGRFVVSITLDGVSETKSLKKLVPIGKELGRDFARFCEEQNPQEMKDMVDWFRSTTRDPHYGGKGATTVSVLRFDRLTGTIDGINLGDSVPLMIVQNPVRGPDGPRHTQFRGVVLAPLHTVANEPGSVYKCWRHMAPFEPDGFRLSLPRKYKAVWLATMSDGYGRVTEPVATRLYERRLVERILAKRYPEFVRVYLPEALAELVPDVRRPKHGRVRFSLLKDNQPLKRAFTDYHQNRASKEERHQMDMVDLDTTFLQTLLSNKDNLERDILGKTVLEHREHGHRTLRWMLRAPYNPQGTDQGIEYYLRQYATAELFSEAMVDFVDRTEESGQPMLRRLRAFMEGLGKIGDDFCVGMIKLTKAGDAPPASPSNGPPPPPGGGPPPPPPQ